MQTEMSGTSSGGRTSSSASHVARLRDGEFWRKPLKEEESGDEEEDEEEEDDFYGGTASSLGDVPAPERDQPQPRNLLKEKPKHDDYLYCEDCKSFFINKCDVHGPALFIPDVAVPLGVADRARQTLPPGLEIRKSGIPDAGLGVFNSSDTIPVGAHFGPYQGDTVEREEAMNSSYSWVIQPSERSEKYIDASSEFTSNWMRYVNCSRNAGEQNLVAFQYRGGIVYRCCRPIERGRELTVFHHEEFSRSLTFSYIWNKKCSLNNADTVTEVFTCSLCPLSYTVQVYLHKHIKRCHNDEYVRLFKSGVIGPLPADAASPRRLQRKNYHCTFCGKGFIYQSSLQHHQHFHTAQSLHQCSQCGKSFTLQSSLQLHRRVHAAAQEAYECAQCLQRFSDQVDLQVHQRSHRGDKPYECSHCGKSFTERGALQRHQHVHTGEKPYHCSECGRSFTQQCNLQKHQRIHTGEKPYQCSHCGKNFSDRCNLQIHQRIHTGEKPYHCSHCGKSFNQQSNLQKHQHIHTGQKPYHCSYCGKSFTQQSNLQKHKRIHTGEKPYHCPQCGKSFNQQSNLQKHQRVHTGEKPYHCSHCGKSFSDRCNLQTHQRTTHR